MAIKNNTDIILNKDSILNMDTDNINNTFFNKNIKYLRELNKLSQEDMGKVIQKERSTISLWERNERYPSIFDVIKLASYFNISVDTLLEEDLKTKSIIHSSTKKQNNKIPVFKDLTSIDLSDSNSKSIIDWLDLPINLSLSNDKYFALVISDKSMLPDYKENDIVIFKKTNVINDNMDYIINIKNESNLFKRITKQSDGILLQSLNSDYETKYYSDDQVQLLPIAILGVAIELRRNIRR